MDKGGYKSRSFNATETLPNYSHGLAIILLVLEYVTILVPAILIGPAAIVTFYLEGSILFFAATAFSIALTAVLAFVAAMFVISRMYDPEGYTSNKKWEDYITVKDEELAKSFKGIKMPMETMIEAYMDGYVRVFVYSLGFGN
jgi:hypothetical protein